MTLAMQTRCVWCLGEQYALNVAGVSGGTAGCHLCGKPSVGMSHEQWTFILRARHTAEPNMKAFTCVHCDPAPATDLETLLSHIRGSHFPFVQTDDPEDDEW